MALIFWKLRENRAYLRDDLGGDATDTGAGQADGARRGGGEVENPAPNERAAVINGDDDAAIAMGHAQLGAERQRAVRTGERILVKALARGGLPTGLVAIERGNAGEHASETFADRAEGRGRRLGFLRGRVRDVARQVRIVMVMMPGFRRRFGGSSTDHHSCGNDGKRRPGAENGSRLRLLQVEH